MITLSSTESEQVALSEATTFARWMRRMLKDFGHEMKTPTKLFMDNKSAIWLTEKMGAFARNKHIMIRRNYTLEGVMDKVIKPAYMPTAELDKNEWLGYKILVTTSKVYTSSNLFPEPPAC
jgi:hypothetical protein